MAGDWDADSEDTILVDGFCFMEIVAGREINIELKTAIIDLHKDEFALGRALVVIPFSLNSEAIAFGFQGEIFADHTGHFHLDDEAFFSQKDVCIGRPRRF